MDVFDRRALLKGKINPDSRADYVATLHGLCVPQKMDVSVAVIVRYVPGRLVLSPDSLAAYLETLAGLDWPTLEDLATAIVKDVSNEMLTRWAQVNVKSEQTGLGHVSAHEVTVEDRQPGWRNDDLIYRLPPV